MTDTSTNGEQLRALVRERYTQSIKQLGTAQSSTAQGGCCGENCCTSTTGDPITSNLYSDTDLEGFPLRQFSLHGVVEIQLRLLSFM